MNKTLSQDGSPLEMKKSVSNPLPSLEQPENKAKPVFSDPSVSKEKAEKGKRKKKKSKGKAKGKVELEAKSLPADKKKA